ALAQRAQGEEDGGALGVVHVARDDRGAPLTGRGPRLVPAGEVLPGGRGDVQAARRGQPEAGQRGVHVDRRDADPVGRGRRQRGRGHRAAAAVVVDGAGLGGGGLGWGGRGGPVLEQPQAGAEGDDGDGG